MAWKKPGTPRGLDSRQVTAEVVRAHETGKAFVPVRVGISHDEFQRRKPEWNMALGASGSIAVRAGGAPAVLPQIVEGPGLLSAMGEGSVSSGHVTAHTAPPSTTTATSARTWIGAGAIGLALGLLAIYGPVRGWRATDDPPPDATAEARDDPNQHTYAFVICEEREAATGAVTMQIVSSSTTGAKWPDDAAVRKAREMDERAEECAPAGAAARSSGPNDPRNVLYVLCQMAGMPTSLEVRSTTRKADGTAYPLKILRAAWPDRRARTLQ